MHRKGFTLVELLVVIGIVSVLIAILLPALASARRAANSAVCLSRMQQLGTATMMYAQDNRQFLPRSSHSSLAHGGMPWGYVLSKYLGHGLYTGPGPAWDKLFHGFYRCPSDLRRNVWSYGLNVWFELDSTETGEVTGVTKGKTHPKLTDIPRSSATILFGELGSGSMADHVMAHYWYLGGTPEVDSKRHGQRSNYTFADGHAESRSFSSTFVLKNGVDLWNPATAR